MEFNYKISIILPIFDVEKYLRNALDSILNQTFNLDELEVLMINDCSSDNSGKIIDEYSNKYNNFKAIHLKKNSGGAAIPRNIGLKEATGEYILFLDSDDQLKCDICEVLYNKIIETDADIVTANAITKKNNEEFLDINYNESYYDIIPDNDLNLNKPFRLWGTLYKKDLIEKNKIHFIDVVTNEDTYFNYNCFFNADRIIFLNDFIGVIHYERKNDEHISLSHRIDKLSIISTIESFSLITDLIQNYAPKNDYVYDPFIKNIYTRFCFKWHMNKQEKIDIFEEILKYENESNYIINLPVQYKLMDYFLNHNLFTVLILIQKVYSSFVMSKFSEKFLIPKIGRNVVK